MRCESWNIHFCSKYPSDPFILFTSLSCLRTGVYCSSNRFITRHSQVWHWYIQRSPLLKTRLWSSWCLQDAAGLHCGQHLSLRLPGALQSHTGSLQVITPSWHVHLLQGFSDGAKVSPLLTSRSSNQQPKIVAQQCNDFFLYSRYNFEWFYSNECIFWLNATSGLTESAFFSGLFQVLRRRAHALVATVGVDAFRSRMTRVPPLDCYIVALININALRALSTIVQGALVAELASAVIPARHVETRGWLMASMQIAGTLIQVEFAAIADVTASTGTSSGCHAFATILASLIAYSYKEEINFTS